MNCVVNIRRAHIAHQGDAKSCLQYVSNVVSLGFEPSSALRITGTTKEAQDLIKRLRKGSEG